MVRRGTQRLRRGRWIREESGQGLVEYALIITIVSLGAVVALGFLSNKINGLFSSAGNSLNNVTLAAGSGDGGDGGGGGGGAPQAPTITAGPSDGGSGSSADYTNPTFSFSGDGMQTGFQCSLDGGAPTGCTSPTSMGPNLAPGPHSFSVQATNGSGSSAATSRSWTVTGGVPTLGSGRVSIDCGRFGCFEHGTADASRGGTWNANGSAITGYYFEWYIRNDSCGGGSSWGGVQDRDPNIGTTTTPTQDYDLPDSHHGFDDWRDYSVRVVVHAVNGVGASTDVAVACADVNG